jgi:GntR family transcriptional regulator, transcriptional repressor for pyruvate dehydrogenase complex
MRRSAALTITPPVERRTTRFERTKLRDQVVDALIEMIEDKGLRPGDAFPSERALVQEFGVSRTVIREAMSTLEVRGLLGIDQGKRPRVASNSGSALRDELRLAARVEPDALWDLFDVRKMFEVEVAALTAARRDPDALAAMHQAAGRMRQHLTEPEGYVDADVQFHNALLLGSGNRILERLMRPVTELMLTSRMITASRRRPTRAALAEHEAILAAVDRGDAKAAAEAMRSHLAATERDLVSALGPRPSADRAPGKRQRQPTQA